MRLRIAFAIGVHSYPLTGSDKVKRIRPDSEEQAFSVHMAEVTGSKPVAPTHRRRSAVAFAVPEGPSLASQNDPRIGWIRAVSGSSRDDLERDLMV